MASFIEHNGEANRSWNLKEIFQGEGQSSSSQVHVPNVDDLVFDFETGFYRVISVDPITKISVLQKWNISDLIGDEVTNDIDAGLSRNYSKSSNAAYVDYTQTPAKVTIDTRTYVFGSESVKVKLFRGTDISNNGTVISRRLSSSNDFLGDDVDLVRLYPDNDAIKRAPPIIIDVQLQEGDKVTLVEYSASGGVVKHEVFTVRLSGAIQSNVLSTRYVTGVRLVSDLISANDNTLINNKLNVPLNTNQFEARIEYSDGNHDTIGIDGSRVKLHGLDAFNESILGPSSAIVLLYYPEQNEHAVNLSSGATPSLSREYRLRNIRDEAAFSLKLWMVPEWRGIVDGYGFKFYLTNDEYTQFLDVTNSVTATLINGDPINTTGFDILQEISLTLVLNDVLPSVYPGHVHVQRVKLTLKSPSIASDNNPWVIDYVLDGTGTLGFGISADYTIATRRLSLRNDKLNQTEWIDDLYLEGAPIFNEALLSAAPHPTHFRVVVGTHNETRNIADWDEYLTIPANVQIDNLSTVRIEWLLDTDPNLDPKNLGVTPLVLKAT